MANQNVQNEAAKAGRETSLVTSPDRPDLQKICAVAWVTFHDPGARLHSNSSLVGGLVADANHKVWLAELGGAHVIAIESPLFPSPARIPLAAVSGFGEA